MRSSASLPTIESLPEPNVLRSSGRKIKAPKVQTSPEDKQRLVLASGLDQTWAGQRARPDGQADAASPASERSQETRRKAKQRQDMKRQHAVTLISMRGADSDMRVHRLRVAMQQARAEEQRAHHHRVEEKQKLEEDGRLRELQRQQSAKMVRARAPALPLLCPPAAVAAAVSLWLLGR